MNSVMLLFDPTPYTRRDAGRKHPSRGMSPGVRAALAQLRQTIESIPHDEWVLRERRWEELNHSLKSYR